ncbi:MAG: DUF2244 domain-containing protein [Proteobacteria bacterium]|nr:DUF2244 domain-containing protein [Pseudomonadota bacterium]
MTPRWERTQSPPPLEGKVYLDTVLRPHRSLSLKAFRLMLSAVIVVNMAIAAVFLSRGAFPVAGFAGLDVFALWLAFRVNYRAAKAEEHIVLTPLQMHVERTSPSGASSYYVLNPVWAKAREESVGVSIWSGGEALRVGAFLSPDERSELARRIDLALYLAKRGG